MRCPPKPKIPATGGTTRVGSLRAADGFITLNDGRFGIVHDAVQAAPPPGTVAVFWPDNGTCSYLPEDDTVFPTPNAHVEVT